MSKSKLNDFCCWLINKTISLYFHSVLSNVSYFNLPKCALSPSFYFNLSFYFTPPSFLSPSSFLFTLFHSIINLPHYQWVLSRVLCVIIVISLGFISAHTRPHTHTRAHTQSPTCDIQKIQELFTHGGLLDLLDFYYCTGGLLSK